MMYEVFLKAWNDLSFKTPGLARVYFKDLIRRYSEPHRYYHDWVHIEKMVQFLMEQGVATATPKTIMATFYHDAIYLVPGWSAEPEFRGMSSEEASATLFRRYFTGMGNDATTHQISDLILTTGEYMTKGSQSSLGDADLIGLSLSDEFIPNGDLIRQEFWQVPEHTFIVDRRKFYEQMLTLPNIFYSQFHREHSEPMARVMMEAEVGRLRQLN